MRKEVLIMPQNYTPEFKKKIVRLHLEEGRTYKSMRLYVLKNQNIYTGSHTRYLRISWLKISLLSGQIKNGVQISPTYS